MQNVQRWLQPFCTWTKARVRPSIASIPASGVARAAMMSPTAVLPSRSTPAPPRSAPPVSAQAAGESFSPLPSTRSTSGMAENVCGSTCAAQPVTTRRAAGRSRLALRIAWRAWRTASPVTAQVFTTTRLSMPAVAACRRIASPSEAFRRQPKVRISTVIVSRSCSASLLLIGRPIRRTARGRTGLRIHRRPDPSSTHGRPAPAIRSRDRRRAA